MATKLEVITTNQGKEGSFYEHFYGRMLEYTRSLCTFREIAVATNPAIRGQPKAKLMDSSDVSMFLGYTKDHVGDVYQFLKLKMNKVIPSQDATWKGQMWGKLYKIKPNHQLVQVDDDKVEESKVKIKEFDIDKLEEVKTASNYKGEVKKGGTKQKAGCHHAYNMSLGTLTLFTIQCCPNQETLH